ncbi:MAG: putative protein kinase ArgK-like GTPase of G3E family [Planctomycetota bacterium]|jgi:putative protein kinase ArgK-like GTPase of G3E family
MKKTILFIFSIFVVLNGFSQEDARKVELKETETKNTLGQKVDIQLESSKTPQVVHTYKTRPEQVNVLFDKVNSMTDGDAYVTELVIKALRDQNNLVKNIISDKDFNKLNKESKTNFVTQSHVSQLINKIKAN